MDAVDLRRVVYEAAGVTGADVRTVRAVLAGRRARGNVHDRVVRALVERGVELPAPQPPSDGGGRG